MKGRIIDGNRKKTEVNYCRKPSDGNFEKPEPEVETFF